MDFLPCKIKNLGIFHIVPRNWFALRQNFYNIEFSLCFKLPVKTKKYNIEISGASLRLGRATFFWPGSGFGPLVLARVGLRLLEEYYAQST